jgi:molybdate transport system ATP-binding protein
MLRVRDDIFTAMLFVSHDATEVQALCDDLIVIQQGRLVAQGSPRSVLIDPRVYPIAERQDFENLLRGKIVAWDRGVAEVLLESGHRLKSASGNGAIGASAGSTVLAGIRAEDIILATSQPQGLSARNILPATLTAIEKGTDGATVAVALAGKEPDILVHIALPTIDALSLKPGQSIYLVIKARGVHLL